MTVTDEARGNSDRISFALTDEQRELRRLAHEFAEKEIRPKSLEYDEHQTHPADVVAKAHEVGLMNPHIPDEYRASASPASTGCWSARSSRGHAGIAVSIIANTLGSAPVMLSGNDDQKAKWLPPLVEEPILCSFGLTEPNAGSDVSGIGTTAVRHGDEYVINGSKMFITNAGHADWLVVFASTDKSKGHKGLSAFVVRPTSTASSSRSTWTRWVSARPTRRRSPSATSRCPPRTGSARSGEGFKIAMKTLDFTRLGTAAGAVGVAQVRSTTSGRVRKDAGAVRAADRDEPGDQLPGRGHGDRDRGCAAARLAGVGLLDQGKRATLQSSYAKRFAADTAMKVTTDAVQIFGGYGHQGVPGREAHARREAVPDLRGDVADPAARDREGDLSPSIRGVVGLLPRES